MARKKKRAAKGTFGDPALPVARRYLQPDSRRWLIAGGVLAALALLAWAAFDFGTRDGRFLSDGPLSSNHANLDQNCAACHTPGGEVTNEACSTCHEKHGDELGVFSFASHYIYRSNDFQRVVPSPDEMPCFSCHVEHEGRNAQITRVPDARCLTCHDLGSFNRDHPEFDFAAESQPDSSALAFTHVRHVSELMKRNELDDPEMACLACHHPTDDGRNFQAIRFEEHCDACHLTTSERTDPLPIRTAAATAGVDTLQTIQAGGEPGTRWSFFIDPNQFRQQGNRVVKGPLYHRDPWVLENLRRLRRTLYPQADLADLLIASPEVEARELATLYTESINTLRAQVRDLRSRPEPEVQRDLEQIEALLTELERRLRDPYAPLDEGRFLLALGPKATDLDPQVESDLQQVANQLTASCLECHRLDNLTIARVQKNQRTLHRAEFDHRAHILQRGCLDCHTEIPIAENLGATDGIDTVLDNASIQNLPKIASCQQCHNPQVATNQCVSCHLFHPDQSRRSQLLLYVDEPPPEGANNAG